MTQTAEQLFDMSETACVNELEIGFYLHSGVDRSLHYNRIGMHLCARHAYKNHLSLRSKHVYETLEVTYLEFK